MALGVAHTFPDYESVEDQGRVVDMVNEIVMRSNVLALKVASDAMSLKNNDQIMDAAERVHSLAAQTARAAEDVLQEIELLKSLNQLAGLEGVISADELSAMIERLDQMTRLFHDEVQSEEASSET